MANKTIIQFTKDGDELEFKSDGMNLMDLMLAMAELKVILFEELENAGLLESVTHDLSTYENKIKFMVEMLEAVEDNNMWKEELLN